MQITGAFLANSAEAVDGLVYALGAFPERWSVPRFPWEIPLSLVVLAEVSQDEERPSFVVTIRLHHPNTREDALATWSFTRHDLNEPTGRIRNIAAIRLAPRFHDEGVHQFSVDPEGGDLVHVPLIVARAG